MQSSFSGRNPSAGSARAPLTMSHGVKKSPQAISAIVVGLNEAHLLGDCLTGIWFCDEIIYVDLGSIDNSVEVAQRHGAEVRHHDRVPSGEYIVAELCGEARHDWILFIDPDENLDSLIAEELMSRFESFDKSSNVGSVAGPWQFYFKGKALVGTPWGGAKPRPFLANRNRFEFAPETHRGRILRHGFDQELLVEGGQIDHYWSNSWLGLVRKHLRYLKTEGGSRFRRGERISLGGVVASVPKTISQTYGGSWDKRDGLQGVMLCALWVWYKSMALFSLWRFERLQKKQSRA